MREIILNRRFLSFVGNPASGRVKEFIAALGVMILALSVAVPAIATPVKISGTPMQGSVGVFAIDSTSSRTVYLANQDNPAAVELYSVPIEGGVSPTKLHPDLVSGQEVDSFAISQDGSFVVFRADFETSGIQYNLYYVPITGGVAPIKLNPDLASNRSVQEFAISQDGSWVVYIADQDTDDVLELYTITISSPGSSTRLNSGLAAGGKVESFLISNDSQYVVYLADEAADNHFELNKVAIAGGIVTRVCPVATPATGYSVGAYKISENSSLIVYILQRDSGGYVLYCYGTGYGRISQDPAAGGHVSGFQLSADSTHAVYRYQETYGGGNPYSLYEVPIWGGDRTGLSGSLVPGGSVEADFLISPDSNRVVFRADKEIDQIVELYSVPTEPVLGPGEDIDDYIVQLSAEFTGNFGDVLDVFTITPDSSRVVYRADEAVDEVAELYSALIDQANSRVKLSGTMQTKGAVSQFMEITNDSQTVVFMADKSTDQIFELYGVPVTGGTPTRLSIDPMPPDSDVLGFSLSPNSLRVVYKADQDSSGTDELYSESLATSPESSTYMLWTR